MGVIICDTRQQAGKHRQKDAWFEANGITQHRSKVPIGDYCPPPAVSVDTKKDIYELAMDIDREHERFVRELLLAQEMGCRLVVLVENVDGVESLEQLDFWNESDSHFAMRRRKTKNPRCRRITGQRLAKACATMERKYGVEFRFVHPSGSAPTIMEILEGGGACSARQEGPPSIT